MRKPEFATIRRD